MIFFDIELSLRAHILTCSRKNSFLSFEILVWSKRSHSFAQSKRKVLTHWLFCAPISIARVLLITTYFYYSLSLMAAGPFWHGCETCLQQKKSWLKFLRQVFFSQNKNVLRSKKRFLRYSEIKLQRDLFQKSP